MNIRSRKYLIISIISAILSVVFFLIYLNLKSTTGSIAFYGLDKETAEEIQSELEKLIAENNFEFKFSFIEDGNLKNGLKSEKPSLLITTSGINEEIAISNAAPKAALNTKDVNIEGMSSSIRSALKIKDNLLSALPVLTNHLEIDIDYPAFKESNMKAIATWDDIETFCKIQKSSVKYPFILAGADSDLTLDIFGALTEALSGAAEYEKAVEIIKSNSGKNFDASKIAALLAEENGSPLNKSVRYLSKLIKAEILHPSTFSLSKTDVEYMLKSRVAMVTIMTLSDHRKIDSGIMSRYSSIYFPSEKSAGERRFTAPHICAIPLANRAAVRKIANELTTKPVQEAFSKSSGLAPVLNQCRVSDKQADDVRFWIASTNAPFSGFSQECDLTEQQKSSLAKALASFVKL